MDNNFNNQQIPNTTPQPQVNADPTMNTAYTDQPQMNTQFVQQPQMNMQYNQQMYGQQQTGYGAYPQQNYGYGQYAYQKQPQPSKVAENVKQVKAEFQEKFSKMGLSTFCLVGIIAAMLLIVGPFMNFASLHFNDRFEYEDEGYYGYYSFDIDVKIKAADGLNMFELSKLSNTLDRAIEEFNDEDLISMDKDDIADEIDDLEDDIIDEAEDETDMDFENLGKEIAGTMQLLIKGQLPLMIAPWVIIISGLGLLVFTVINNKKMKIVCSALPIACVLWLMICSSNFFSYMGIGAIAIILGSVAGIVSALKD